MRDRDDGKKMRVVGFFLRDGRHYGKGWMIERDEGCAAMQWLVITTDEGSDIIESRAARFNSGGGSRFMVSKDGTKHTKKMLFFSLSFLSLVSVRITFKRSK